jgi:hypothetical protein
MEDPYIRQEYQALLQQNGVEDRMKPEWYDVPEGFSNFIKPR